MGDEKFSDSDPWRAARATANEVGSAVSKTGRRLFSGLADMTRRPEEEDRESTAESAEDAESLGDQARDVGRGFASLMGAVSVKTGRTLRKAAYGVSDSVRNAAASTRNSSDETDD